MPSISPIQWQNQIFGVDSHNTEELKPWVTRASAATMTRVVACCLPWAPWPRMGVASCNGSRGQRETVTFGLRFDRIQQYSTMFSSISALSFHKNESEVPWQLEEFEILDA